jgi:endonuclease YncB( thermonuclease family)
MNKSIQFDMRALILVIVLLVFPYISFAGQYKCLRVVDGDTIKVANNGNQLTIRLVGIDAPELPKKEHLLGQAFCMKAKEHLANLVLNKMVDIKFYGKGRHERLLGEVFVDGVNINLEMIYAGLAEVYRGKPAKNLEITIYRDAERKAKESVQGIWVLRDQYFSPWDWREIYR